MDTQHFRTGTKTTSAPALARAFFASLAVHAVIFGVLWQIVTQPQTTPNMLRIELAPPSANAVTAVSASTATETTPTHGEPQHATRVVSARSSRPTSATIAGNSHTAHPVSSQPTPAGMSSPATESTRAATEVATSAPAELAIDLRVLDWLARHRNYPLAARRARIEGVVQLHVTLLPDGRLVHAMVAHSSGHPLLDQAALDLMTRASPLPAEFAGERTEQIELQLPIVYRMRASST